MTLKYRRDLPIFMKELGIPLIGAEIGCAEGFNAADLLRNGMEKLYMVDIWQQADVKGDGANNDEWHEKNYRAAMFRIEQWKDKAVVLKGFSADMVKNVPDESLGLVYLDAGHSYPDVYMDLLMWFPKLMKGGIMAGHDYLNKAYGVKEAVAEFVGDRFKVSVIPEDKDEDAGFWFRKD